MGYVGNTVGSTNTDFCNLEIDSETAYIIGLWCADGHHRTSSVGISNVDKDLLEKFEEFFLKFFTSDRLKLDTYEPIGKRKTKAFHLYVNSRPLLRKFFAMKENVLDFIHGNLISPYFAGRFDGDGSVAKDFYQDCRIVYGNYSEAERDKTLLIEAGFNKVKIYHYRSARTFCLYVSRMETNKFLSFIYPFSVRLQKSVFVPRRDLSSGVKSELEPDILIR
jgi:hypothetical protein